MVWSWPLSIDFNDNNFRCGYKKCMWVGDRKLLYYKSWPNIPSFTSVTSVTTDTLVTTLPLFITVTSTTTALYYPIIVTIVTSVTTLSSASIILSAPANVHHLITCIPCGNVAQE